MAWQYLGAKNRLFVALFFKWNKLISYSNLYLHAKSYILEKEKIIRRITHYQ